MLPQLITKYLASNRRLNIPSLGAFIVKADGVIIFSELLKSDDGVLRTLLENTGLSQIESAATIDRFLFELRHATKQSGKRYEAKGLGVFRATDDGKLIFTQTVKINNPVEEVIEIGIPAQTPATPWPQPIERPKREARRAKKQRRKGVDKVLLFGIVAAVVALCVLAYGFYASNIETITELMTKWGLKSIE